MNRNNNATLTREDKRTLGLSSLGGALEFYDFVIFVFYAKLISELFFPSTLSPFWAMLNTYGIFAAGYFFRPLGGIIMAHFGDLVGRKRLFTLSILLMALPTLCIGIMPTFENIGYAAPLLLLFMRILQGIAIGGEIPAAWTFVSEHVQEQRVGFANGLLTAGLSLGILLGSLMSLFISLKFTSQEIQDWAWRIPFILGGIFGFITLYLRSYLKETPVFKAMQKRKELAKELPVKQVLAEHKIATILGMVFTWFLTGCILVLILSMPTLLTTTFGFERAEAFKMQSSAIVMQMIGCISAGLLADKFGGGKIMAIGVTLVALISSIFFYSLGQQSNQTIFFLYMAVGLFSGTVGIVSYMMVKMFPAQIRFTGISFSYNVAYAIAGGLTFPFVQWLSLFSPIGAIYYIWLICLVTLITAFIFKSKFEQIRQ